MIAKTCLLQLGVLRLGFFQDGDVGVGVFPEREEIFVGGERPDAGGTHPAAPELLDNAVVRDGLTDHWRESYFGAVGKSMKAVELAMAQQVSC